MAKRKPKLTWMEKLRKRGTSKTCRDPRQLELEDAVKQRAFAKLDRAIADATGDD